MQRIFLQQWGLKKMILFKLMAHASREEVLAAFQSNQVKQIRSSIIWSTVWKINFPMESTHPWKMVAQIHLSWWPTSCLFLHQLVTVLLSIRISCSSAPIQRSFKYSKLLRTSMPSKADTYPWRRIRCSFAYINILKNGSSVAWIPTPTFLDLYRATFWFLYRI